jgi:hypothetical protein
MDHSRAAMAGASRPTSAVTFAALIAWARVFRMPGPGGLAARRGACGRVPAFPASARPLAASADRPCVHRPTAPAGGRPPTARSPGSSPRPGSPAPRRGAGPAGSSGSASAGHSADSHPAGTPAPRRGAHPVRRRRGATARSRRRCPPGTLDRQRTARPTGRDGQRQGLLRMLRPASHTQRPRRRASR